MKDKFIFDVDGTLTPSRQAIDKKFAIWFKEFCKNKDVYLVTGSDRPKTIEQIGDTIYNLAQTVYNCSGNDVWKGTVNIRSNDWKLPEEPHNWLSLKLSKSKFPLRTGLHFEHRPGMVNFSIVGRNATLGERKLYVKYDEETNERNKIAEVFNSLFPDIEARPGGETGIDIAPKGADKSQIINDFNSDDFIYFFGDRMDTGGNDYPLARQIKNGRVFHVTGWQDTWEKLNAYNANRT